MGTRLKLWEQKHSHYNHQNHDHKILMKVKMIIGIRNIISML
jgi:hypothetical protein